MHHIEVWKLIGPWYGNKVVRLVQVNTASRSKTLIFGVLRNGANGKRARKLLADQFQQMDWKYRQVGWIQLLKLFQIITSNL